MTALKAEQRERMTVEIARTRATLDVQDMADLLNVHTNYVYKNAGKIPGRLRELKGIIRFSAPTVIAWLEGTLPSSGKTTRP